MTATTHWLATASGQAVLERGGNAFDAAVAAAFVLHIVEPHLNGPGGDVNAIVVSADDPTPRVLMGQGPAPAGATIEHYRSLGLQLAPGSGALAAAVPGSVDAWLLLLRDLGSWELPEVLAYALHYAEQGHPLADGVVRTIAGVRDLFIEHWPTSAARWLQDGAAPVAGTVVTNPEYAAVLRSLIAVGEGAAGRPERINAARSEWKTGIAATTVEAFVKVPHRHSSGTDLAGVITAADFAAFDARWEPASTTDFRGHTIAKIGPYGQGPVLLQALQILQGYEDNALDPGTELGAHHIIEALKLALADREAFYGDPEDGQVPMERLLSDDYATDRRKLIGERASAELRPGQVEGHQAYLPPLLTDGDLAAGTGEPTVAVGGDGSGEPTVSVTGVTRGDTCHIDIVDQWGNFVSATPSGGWLQSSPHIPELGFCLGSRLQMTWLDPASPSALRPGARPRTTLSPTVVLKDGVPVMALGTPGGDQQDQWQLVYLLYVLIGGYTPQQAIDAPMLHTTSHPGSFWPRTWSPAGVVVEGRIGADVIAGLRARGHQVTAAGNWSLGRLSAVTRDPDTGILSAAANPRGMQGYAAGR